MAWNRRYRFLKALSEPINDPTPVRAIDQLQRLLRLVGQRSPRG